MHKFKSTAQTLRLLPNLPSFVHCSKRLLGFLIALDIRIRGVQTDFFPVYFVTMRKTHISVFLSKCNVFSQLVTLLQARAIRIENMLSIYEEATTAELERASGTSPSDTIHLC